MTGPQLWGLILIIGAVTYLTRALPLLMRPRAGGDRTPPAWLDALGPCILAAIAVSVLLPEARAAIDTGAALPFALGSAAAAGTMLWRRDAGLATLAGMAGYALGAWAG